MSNIMSDIYLYIPTRSTRNKSSEPNCSVCNDHLKVYIGGEATRCTCLLMRMYTKYVPTWISNAPKTTNDRPYGKFNCLIGSEDAVGCWLDNVYQDIIDRCPNSFENLLPKIISDDSLVDAKFSQGNLDEISFLESPIVWIEQTALRGHGSMPNVVYQYVRQRVNKNRTTWLIRSTPIDTASFDYSPELERLVSSRFTITDLR